MTYELQLYGDGAMFSYAVAAQDVWAFHWHNISGRLTVFLLTLWPAEIFAGATGNPWDGVLAYGFLFYVAPLIGLLGDLLGGPLQKSHYFYLCLFLDRPALPSHLRISDRNVDGARVFLADACRRSIRAAHHHRRWVCISNATRADFDA